MGSTNEAIARLLDSAKLCLERGQKKMAKAALDEAIERAEQCEDLDMELDERIDEINEAIGELLAIPERASNIPRLKRIPEGEEPCPNCHGTGRYLRPDGIITKNVCVRCKGKAWQDSADKVRNKNYDALQEVRLEQRRAVSSSLDIFRADPKP